MSGLLNEIQRIICDMASDKPAARHKAVELLNQKMDSSRDALYAVLVRNPEVDWTQVFEAVNKAIIKHTNNLQDAREKSYKTLADKCSLYGNVMDKIIDYNLEIGREKGHHFLAKSTIFDVFENDIKQRIVVEHFGINILNLLDRGIYQSTTYICDLKVSEYSRTLSYLFELNVGSNEVLRSKILKCIIKTIKLAQNRVQLHADLADYLPTLSSYSQEDANTDRRIDIMLIYNLFVNELSVNYHHKLCIHIQEILPILCDFHNGDTFRRDSKCTFFECVISSLRAMYPKLKDHGFNTFHVPIHESWHQTMRKLRTIIDMEIRNSEKLIAHFPKMSALIMYIVLWHVDANTTNEGENAPAKRLRIDRTGSLIQLIDKRETSFNEKWFAIFAELLQLSSSIINAGNYQQILQITLDVLLINGNGKSLPYIRQCLTSILAKERELLKTCSISVDFLAAQWSEIASYLISDSRPNAEIVSEKQLILQALIKHNKLSAKSCKTLLQSIQNNEQMRRNECLATIREIFINADACGLKKASADMEPIISWAYGTEKSSATQIIYNIGPMDVNLLADTFAIGIINFLDEQQLQQLGSSTAQHAMPKDATLQLLNYKYNKQLVCLDAEFQSKLLRCQNRTAYTEMKLDTKNCLFQNNYEFLMRLLNLQPSNEHTTSAIIKNLKCLYKLSCNMERLLYYKVFDANNLDTCPLIKRIGLFLSHIEFQYKANQPELLNDNDLGDILIQQVDILDVFNSTEILLQYLEKQPIEMMLEFIGNLLKHYCNCLEPIQSVDRKTMIKRCLHILGRLCASDSHCPDAFLHISINVKSAKRQPTEVLLVTKMLCSCTGLTGDIIEWLVDKLKGMFQYHYTNVEIISELLEHMPTIFNFVYNTDTLLDDMMLAMISLLKLALKKAYPSSLAVKIVSCVGDIAHRCPNIFSLDNFAVICMSVAKFLSTSTLEVRLATTTTLCLLLNTSYCMPDNEVNAVEKSQRHLEFCKQLYESIEWNKFLYIVGDLEHNSHAVAIQTFVAFFAFSSFHQEIVLKELLVYIVKHKLHETDFCALDTVVPCYKQTMRQLMMPYADAMLNRGFLLNISPSRFPYYLCYKSKAEFIKEHAKNIMTCAYIYGNRESIQRAQKYNRDDHYISQIKAYLWIGLSRCNESKTKDFQQHYQNLQRNLTECQIDPIGVPLNAITLCYAIRLMLDFTEFDRLFDSTVQSNRSVAWYNINMESLFHSLELHLSGNRWSRHKRVQAMSVLMFEQQAILIDVLTTLKTECHEAVIPSHMLDCFFRYCCIADAILDAVNELAKTANASTTLLEINCVYFVRDIWFFVCRFLPRSKCAQLQRAGLKFLHLMQTKQSFSHPSSNETNLDELVKLLILCAQHMETLQLKQLAGKELKRFIDEHRDRLNMQMLLEENSECEYLNGVLTTDMANTENLSSSEFISAFLTSSRSDRRLHGLREYIADHKLELQKYDDQLFKLINHLLSMVRESGNEDCVMDALKCLGAIGPIKMQNNSYYFQTDFDVFNPSDEEAMDQFVRVIMDTLNKQLFYFDTSTQQALIQVIGHVVHSDSGVRYHVMHPYLRIFYHKRNKTSFLNSFMAIPAIDWTTVLKSCEHLEYEPWMCAFMSQAFIACGWQGFHELAQNSFVFAHACLHPFVKLLLANKEVHLESLCVMLDHFFSQFCASAPGIYQEKRAIKRFLYMCECIRLTNTWRIPINLCNAIVAGNHCQAYFLSIMYLELWACETNHIPNSNILENDQFQKLAKKAYESIGCLDAMTGFLNPLRSRMDYLSLNNDLFGCWLESDNLDMPNRELRLSITKSNGLLSLANMYQRSEHTEKMEYELFWRLGQWDEPVETQQNPFMFKNMETEFDKQHYLALKSMAHREEENTVSAIKNAYHSVKQVLRDISIESLQSVYKYMTWLSALQQAEDFAQIQFSTQLSSTQTNEIFNKWQVEMDLNYGNFNCQEYVLSHQISLLNIAGTRANRRIQQYYKQSPVDTYLLKCIGVCKDAGKWNMAKKYISTLRALPNIQEATKISVLLEDADVHVKTGNFQIAKATLQHVVSNNEFQYCLQRVPALRMQGEFLLNSNAQNLSYILEHNFNKSMQLLDQFEKHKQTLMAKFPDIFPWPKFGQFVNDNRKAVHAAIAKYADREYQQLHNYRNSQEYKMIAEIIQQNRDLAGTVSTRDRSDRDRHVGAINLNRFANHDEAELQKIEDNLTEHLCTAIEHYIAYCQLDSGSSSAEIYRIIALWFTNDQNAQMLKKISDLIKNVPSYKFICALNQMVGRLTSKKAEFHKVLVDVLVRCGQDHPQHTFYKLYPLVYAFMDGNHSNTQRADIAKTIIGRICTANNAVARCSKQFEAMFPALIGFANTYLVIEPNGRPTAKGVLDKLKKLNALKMDTIQCATVSLAVQPSQKYDIISMAKWTDDYTLCSGLNAPIRISCLCSDGVVRAQLIKGKDDLRQDAVMQQVFGIVNELLNSDSEFIERKLQLRTYQVTPLSMRSGILEWCSNTIPVGTYLVGNNTSGAHMRYNPNGWTNRKCREMSMAALKKPESIRRAVYNKICENVKPVFHHFFLEKYPIPGVWFERRLAYINSVATTSMVGYVLGLGDRHTQNILIDEATGEVIHIDFGIAFEQGKIQTTKETVPFRLTRDFVAPMGVCGTNGVFTKSCEATMHILRRYKPVLTTILEVLLYDPLFIWGVLSNQSRESSKESKNLLAQRALLLVQHKLEGREHGVLDLTSVETQVQRLINEATLPSNLALLYPGWDPYL